MRRDSAADWVTEDPIILSGEIGYETDTGFWKWGDGVTAWTSLTYQHNFGGDVTLEYPLPTLNITSTAAADDKSINFNSSAGLEADIIHSGSAARMYLRNYAPNHTNIASGITIAEDGVVSIEVGGEDGTDAFSALILGFSGEGTFFYGLNVVGPFTSEGIDDNANAIALTIGSDEVVTFTEKVVFDASSSINPSFNAPEGVAPSSPVDGDFWVTATDALMRINGVSEVISWASDLDAHTGDATIHFTEASIDHAAILNIGTNAHSVIDTHLADATIHFTQAAIDIPLTQGANDVTATFGELNLLDLSGLTTGWALLADSATTASWQALPVGGVIGGSITNDQIAVGAATADDIEGSSALSWNGTSFHVAGAANFDDQVDINGLNAALNITSTSGNARLNLDGPGPQIRFDESDGGVDQKIWEQEVISEQFRMLITEDDFASDYVWMAVERSGTGTGIQIDTIDITSETDVTFNTPDLVVTGTINSPALILTSTGGTALDVSMTSITGIAATFYSNTANRTQPLVEITNDHASGAGHALVIQEDPAGHHLILQGQNGKGIQMQGGIKIQERPDHANSPGIFYGELWLRDDANQTLMFTDEASVDFEIAGTDVASGGIGGSITDDQIAVGATTADDIEGAATFSLVADSLRTPGGIRFTERPDHIETPTATFGELWLKDGVGQALMFTTDLGTDYELTSRVGIDGSVSVNQIARWASTTEIGGGSDFTLVGDSLVLNSATSPAFSLTDTGGSVTTRIITTSTYGEIGTTSAHDFRIISGFATAVTFDQSTQLADFTGAVTIAGDFIIPTNFKLYLDGGGDSYITENSDAVAFFNGGLQTLTLNSNGTSHFAGQLNLPAGATAKSSLRIAEGVAPTIPIDGDHWVTAAGEYFVRLDGVSVDLAAGGSGDVSVDGTPLEFQLAIWTGATNIEGQAALKWQETFQILTIGDGTVANSARLVINGDATSSPNMNFQQAGSSKATLGYVDTGDVFRLFTGGVISFQPNEVEALLLDTDGIATFAEKVVFNASTTADPSFNIPEGAAPTAPVDGDVWLTAAGEYFARLNGVSVDLAAGGSGGSPWTYTLQTGTSYTAVAGDFVVASNTGTVTITLPSGHSVDDTIIVKKTGATGTVTVDGNASETIDGALTFDLTAQYASITLISDGTNWLIV
jgi:hypothetical protein